MKLILIVFTITVYISSNALGQTYSRTVKDSVIIAFMNDVLNDKASYKSAFNKSPKRVFHKATHMRDADFNLLTNYEESQPFEKKFKKLYSALDLSQTTLDFLETQYSNMNDTTWQHSIENVIFKKRYKKNYFRYSIPMFSEDYQFALLWRYTYCGSLCAYSELHWYKFENGNWELVKLIDGYIS